MRRTVVNGLAIAIAIGCRTVPQMPVQLEGDPTSIAWLGGSWTGQYWGGAGGSGGSLSFLLRSGTSALYGDVTMIDPQGEQIRAAEPMDARTMRLRAPRHLRFEAVRVEAGGIHGVLEPYFAPDCECIVTTRFIGRLVGDRITGSFETRAGGRVQAVGSWEMKRTGDGR